MANLKPGVRDVRKLAEALDSGEFESAEDMARAALELAFEIYEAKSKYMVAGQLRYAPELGFVRDSDDKVLLGPYGTEKQADTAGRSLAGSAVTGEEFRWWLLPVQHGTPHAWFTARKKLRVDQALADDPRTASRDRWLQDLAERARTEHDIVAQMLDKPTLDQLADLYPESGYRASA